MATLALQLRQLLRESRSETVAVRGRDVVEQRVDGLEVFRVQLQLPEVTVHAVCSIRANPPSALSELHAIRVL